jgi:hypothetical protein
MEPLKLRVLSQFLTPIPLGSPDEIEVVFPYGDDTLLKRKSYGHVRILNDQKGEIEVLLSPFEVQGLNEGENQSFVVKLFAGSKIKTVMFERCLHVKTELREGEPRKVIFKK